MDGTKLLLSSDEFYDYITGEVNQQGLDSQRVGFLFESCQARFFVENFVDVDCLAMTSTYNENAHYDYLSSREAYFSSDFWYYARFYSDDAVACWEWADGDLFTQMLQNPQISNELSIYTFF